MRTRHLALFHEHHFRRAAADFQNNRVPFTRQRRIFFKALSYCKIHEAVFFDAVDDLYAESCSRADFINNGIAVFRLAECACCNDIRAARLNSPACKLLFKALQNMQTLTLRFTADNAAGKYIAPNGHR